MGLTIPRAAATLAATIVGFNIGLFDQSAVNAALVLILVSTPWRRPSESRPGRLVAALAGCGRHETPGT